MTKKGGRPKKPEQPDQPELGKTLLAIMEQARVNAQPVSDPALFNSESLQKVTELLAPGWVPPEKEGGKARLREPLLMVSWQRARGQWQAVISDRVLKLRITVYLDGLGALAESVGELLSKGLYEAREIN